MIPPAGVANYRPGHAEVFHVHETSVEHAWTLDGGHSWSQWHPMQFDIPILDVTAGSKGPGQEEVFALGEDGIIRHRWLIVDPATDQHDGWSHCQELSCPPLPRVRQLAAASIAPGHLEVFAVDATGQLWSRFYWSDKGWSEWSPWEAPGRLDGVQASAVRNPQDPATRAVLIVEEPTGTQWARAYRISRPGWGDWTRVGDAVPTTRGIAEFVADRRGEALQWEDGALLPLNGTWLGSTTDNTGVTLDSAHPKAIALPATSRAMHRGDQPD